MRIAKNVKVLAAGVAMVCGMTAAPAAASGPPETRAAAAQAAAPGAARQAGHLGERVAGTWTDDAGKTGKVHGTVTPTGFKVADDGQSLLMTADVVLRATGKGAPKGSVTKTISTPVQDAAATGRHAGQVAGASTLAAAPVPNGCDILSLDLGPLTLDVLGLVVVLQPVVLDIVAVPGAGNLLGNLLCSVAGLLDGGGLIPGLLQQIGDLLNQILGALNLGLPA